MPTDFTVPMVVGLGPPKGGRFDGLPDWDELLDPCDVVVAPATAPPLRARPSAMAAALVTRTPFGDAG